MHRALAEVIRAARDRAVHGIQCHVLAALSRAPVIMFRHLLLLFVAAVLLDTAVTCAVLAEQATAAAPAAPHQLPHFGLLLHKHPGHLHAHPGGQPHRAGLPSLSEQHM